MYVGIDNGGTTIKAAVFDDRGQEIARASSPATPLLDAPDGYHQRDMLALWRDTAATVRRVLADVDPAAIRGVGCTGHGKGLYLWGDGQPAYPAIASTDQRARAYVEQWQADGTAAAAAVQTLQPVTASQPVALLAWLRDHEPDSLAATRYIFEAKDFTRFMLTGEAYTEYTDSSGTSLMDLNTRQFDRGLLERFGLGGCVDKLPPLRWSFEPCGAVTPGAAAATGLRPGTPVCGGMFDIDACALALGVRNSDALCAITGTWSINEYIAREPVRGDTTTRNSLFCMPGYYLIEESSPTSAGNLDWVVSTCLSELSHRAQETGADVYAMLDALVDGLPPDQSEVVFLPFLYGTNTRTASACFAGLCSQHTQAHLVRAVYEGVVFSHRTHIDRLFAFRTPPRAIRLAGGAARSRVWVQLFADALGLSVEVVPAGELGALGSAMAAAVASGRYADYPTAIDAMVTVAERIEPRPEFTAVYQRKYDVYRRLTAALDTL